MVAKKKTKVEKEMQKEMDKLGLTSEEMSGEFFDEGVDPSFVFKVQVISDSPKFLILRIDEHIFSVERSLNDGTAYLNNLLT